MAYTLIGGTAVGTVLILLFLPALYAAWFRIKPTPNAYPGTIGRHQWSRTEHGEGCGVAAAWR